MSWSNRVIWQEGMFLRTQHFQQQDRWAEALVRSRTTALRPFGWGLSEMQVSRDLLAQGRFAVAQASGCFQDGTPFSIPGEADHPTPLDLPDNARNVLVYLAMPYSRPGRRRWPTPRPRRATPRGPLTPATPTRQRRSLPPCKSAGCVAHGSRERLLLGQASDGHARGGNLLCGARLCSNSRQNSLARKIYSAAIGMV